MQFSHINDFSAVYTGNCSGKQDHCDLRQNDERWSQLISTCSSIDSTNFTCISTLYCHVKNLVKFKKMYFGYLLEISGKL